MSIYDEADYLQLSGLQHFLFCRRQWALIHIENLWQENYRTVDGQLMHRNVHDEGRNEKRGDRIILRGMRVSSAELGVSGQCDAVEFLRDANGIVMSGWDGLWRPFPVEYKHGQPKQNPCDAAQLCGQAMCLEEMLCCQIDSGALYYGEIHQREQVLFTQELRQTVRTALEEMHDLASRGYTPEVRPQKGCNACSLKELCLPKMKKAGSVEAYLKRMEVLP